MDAVISIYPLPEPAAGPLTESLALSNLRLLGPLAAFRALRARRYGRVTFRLGDGDPPELRAVACLVVGLMNAEHKGLANAGEPSEPLTLADVLRAGASLAFAGVLGALAALANAWTVRRFRGGRAARPPAAGDGVAYLRASFGLPRMGGSVGHTSGVVNALARLKFRVQVFACAEPVGLTEAREFRAVPLPRSATYPHELNAHRFSRRFYRVTASALVRKPVAFLYERYSINDLSGIRLARKLGRPLVLEYNGSEVWAQKHWGRALFLQGLSRRMEVACLREADLVVTVSEALEHELLAMGIQARRVLFYPNCVDAVLFDPARFGAGARRDVRARLGLAPEDYVTTFVGTFGRWHGAEVLARAIRLLPERIRGRRLRFLFVGDGVTAPESREILAAERATGRAVFAGARPQQETPEVLAASDAFASPHVPNPDGTPFFGSPTKLFEYMAMERPIVASDLDQIGRILKGWAPGTTEGTAPERLAILVRPADPESLARGLEEAASLDPAAAAGLGAAARAAVLRSFRWESCVAAFAGRLRELDGGECA